MKRLIVRLVLLLALATPALAYNGRGFIGGFIQAAVVEAVERLNIPHGDTPPTTGQVEGDIFWDTDDEELSVWNGSSWVVVTGGGGGGSYTDEDAQDAAGTILVDTTTIDFTYNDATPSIIAGVIDDSITNAKLSNVTTATFKGRTTAGTGDPEDLTVSQAKTLLSLTGTNSGDQTITLTSDVTGSGTGSFATTIANDAVTNAKLANVATATFKGRTTAGTGDSEDLTVSQSKTLLNLAGTNSGDQTITLTSDVTGSGTGSFAATIANDAVTYAKIQNISAASRLLGRGSASGAGDTQEISLGGTLSMSGTTLSSSADGGNADTLDTLDSLQFLRADIDTTYTGGTLTVDGSGIFEISAGAFNVTHSGTMTLTDAGSIALPPGGFTGAGSGSGLDADFLDGIDSSAFVLASADTELAQDAVGTILTDSSTIDFTYNDATPSITAIAIDGSITNAKLANMTAGTVKGRAVGAGTGAPTDIAQGSGGGLDADTVDAKNPGSASGLATLDGSSLVVQNPANATSTSTASKIPIADGSGKLDTWVSDATGSVKGKVQLAGQLGGSAASPTVTGITETGGPTALALGAIADGELVVRSGSSLVGTATSNTCPAGQATGVKTTRNTAAQLQMVPSSADSKARLALYDGSAWKCYTVTSTETADITASGASGLDTSTEAASTFYHLWAIGKSDGTFDLLLSVSATAPTMPTGYTYKRLIGGDANDASSDFVPFNHLKDGRVEYNIVGNEQGIMLVSAGTATTATAIDASSAIPNVVGTNVVLGVVPNNSNATVCRIDISITSSVGATDRFWFSNLNSGGAHRSNEDAFLDTSLTGSRSTAWYYKWSAAVAGRTLDLYVLSWNLGIGWAN